MKWRLFLVFVFWLFFHVAFAAADEVTSDGRFQVFGNGTVLDTQSKLMWAAQDNGEDVNWEEARKYCQSYGQGGYSDWRLPTQGELVTLFDPASLEKYKIFSPFTLTSCCPWTSDTRRTEARSIFFLMGERAWYKMVDSAGFRALPVRKAE